MSCSLISLIMNIICQTPPYHLNFNNELGNIFFPLSSSRIQFRLELWRLSGDQIE